MKTLLILFLLSGPQPEKGDNLIVIQSEKTPEENFEDFGRYLVAKGYTFQTKDNDFLTLVTAPRESEKGVSYKLIITFVGNEIRIGALIQGLAFISLEPIWKGWEYRASKGSFYYQAWQGFDPVLREYNDVDYIKE